MIASITRGAQEKSWTQSRAALSPFFCALGDDANAGSYDDERDFSMGLVAVPRPLVSADILKKKRRPMRF